MHTHTELLSYLGVAVILLGFVGVGVLVWRDAQKTMRSQARAPVRPVSGALAARTQLVPAGPIGDEEALGLIGPPGERWVRELRELGFDEIGRFQKEEEPDRELWALVKPADALWAVVHVQSGSPIYLELVSEYEDRAVFDVTTLERFPELGNPPGWSAIHLGNVPASELYRRMLADRPQRPLKPATAEQFAASYEAAYARQRDWQILRGGLNEQELREVAAWRGDPPIHAEEMAQLLAAEQAQTLLAIREVFERRFLEETDLSAAELYKVRSCLNVIHDRLPIQSVLECFGLSLEEAEARLATAARSGVHDDWLDIDQLIPLDKWPARQAFEALNGLLPEIHRARCHAILSAFDGAIEADCYGPPGKPVTAGQAVLALFVIGFFAASFYMIYDVCTRGWGRG